MSDERIDESKFNVEPAKYGWAFGPKLCRTLELNGDTNALLREIMFQYKVRYGYSDPEARRAIARDLRNFYDIENPRERFDRQQAKKNKKLLDIVKGKRRSK